MQHPELLTEEDWQTAAQIEKKIGECIRLTAILADKDHNVSIYSHEMQTLSSILDDLKDAVDAKRLRFPSMARVADVLLTIQIECCQERMKQLGIEDPAKEFA